ncbi:glutathione S-transferase family protein [Nannocystis pusilla]|uniref:Glutathione S-transferase family protein n=1 Tax=Nannocystis pusilla TaxID=889268 RepID=A0ABS7TMQ0_9BACT|nr:glutathione S-transferase family protein [Nannocystis pusilla]MBZ5709504.1 glutathione S-transferase family protein [Nannocystis pusilla]
MSILLYAAPMSSATPVVHALAELDVPHERVSLDLSAGDQRRPEFLALNPNGKVPTLVVDGTPMFEALAIITWLGESFGVARGLWPAADAPERLEAMSWATWGYVTFTPAIARLNYATSDRVPRELHSPAMAEHTHRELQALLGLVDQRLATRRYLLGDAFTLVDLIVASAITYSTFCGVPVADHPHVKDWLRRFQERPTYRRAWGVAAA